MTQESEKRISLDQFGKDIGSLFSVGHDQPPIPLTDDEKDYIDAQLVEEQRREVERRNKRK